MGAIGRFTVVLAFPTEIVKVADVLESPKDPNSIPCAFNVPITVGDVNMPPLTVTFALAGPVMV